ncbi:MAG TPA: FixH family protein [Rugosibacter sp.]
MKRLPSVSHSRPWYKEPWPWILMSGPFIVVIAALTTAWIAVKTDDGLVTADYYKKGLAINQTLVRSEQASKSGLTAGIRLADHGLFIRLQATDPAFVLPSLLLVSVLHPTRAGLDQSFQLMRTGDSYRSDRIHLPVAGHWLVLLEDDKKTWRLLGNIVLPDNGETIIGATKTTR